MPDLARLAADLAEMRAGRGPRRLELRRLLAMIHPELRRMRNLERLRLANAQAQIRMLDTRCDPRALANLQQAAEASAQRLSQLDQQIIEAIAQQLRPR
jgi:hypothetical protein